MSLSKSKKHWEDMGDLDPFWSILTEPGTKHGNWDIKKFFETGSDEISCLISAAERLGLPKQREWALDFGCGVGRLTRALAPLFQNVVGIDISKSMLRRAVDLILTPIASLCTTIPTRSRFPPGSLISFTPPWSYSMYRLRSPFGAISRSSCEF